METKINKILEGLELLKEEVGADEIKFYYVANVDYCFKFIKDDKIVLVVRRGLKRK